MGGNRGYESNRLMPMFNRLALLDCMFYITIYVKCHVPRLLKRLSQYNNILLDILSSPSLSLLFVEPLLRMFLGIIFCGVQVSFPIKIAKLDMAYAIFGFFKIFCLYFDVVYKRYKYNMHTFTFIKRENSRLLLQ